MNRKAARRQSCDCCPGRRLCHKRRAARWRSSYRMLLSVPLCTPFTQYRGCGDVGASLASFDTQRQRSLRVSGGAGGDVKLASVARVSAPKRRSCAVFATGKDAAGGLPASREAAERRRVLLKYVREVQPALVEQFVADGPPAVVAAMKNTITNMLGTLPPQFFTVTISTVGENMSQLMLSVMMTGYLFRNAQYRLELRNALGGAAIRPGGNSTSGQSAHVRKQGTTAASKLQRAQSAPEQGSVLDQEAYAPGVQKSRVQGDVLLWHKENGLETLEAVQYIELLEGEVSRLRQQLMQLEGQPHQQQPLLSQQQQQPTMQQPQQQGQVADAATDSRQLPVPVNGSSSLQQQGSHVPAHAAGPAGLLVLHEESTNELLEYLRGLDAASLADLTGCADSEIAGAMESFVGRLMGTTDRDSLSRAGSDCTAQELAKVMFWLMIVGYTMRGLEVRWDMQKAVLADRSSSGGGESRLSCDNSHEAW